MESAEIQNITLSLPKDVLKRVKHLAVLRGSSVSRMLTEMLIELVAREDAYSQARAEHLMMMENASNLGGRLRYTREELHERRQLYSGVRVVNPFE